MAVQRYTRKPQPVVRNGDTFAARYEPGQPVADLAAVARMAGDEAEIMEVAFPSGKRVLLAWFMKYPDGHPAEPDYVTVEPGGYLAWSSQHYFLYGTDDADLRQFYDLTPDTKAKP